MKKEGKQLTAIDLFCGAGGISVGLQEAGFKVIAGIDNNEKYIQSFRHNFPTAKTINGDLFELSPEKLMKKLGLKVGELDILVGGPPCQGFSKNVPVSKRPIDSKNNKLVNEFLRYCEELKPRFIIMENVAEMRNGYNGSYTNAVESRLRDAGYKVHHRVFLAAEYGVPQRRRRAFFLARRDGKPIHIPVPSNPGKANHITVSEAISDLPFLEQGQGEVETPYAKPPENGYQRLVRKHSVNKVKNHIAKPLKPLQLQRLLSIKPGQGIKDLPPEIRPKGGYSGAYGRLTPDMIAPTITRWVFHPGSGRWGHYDSPRLLTIREAARIQGFPDSFEFVGTYVDQAGQIGNAVPPLLAEKVARAFLDDRSTEEVYKDSSLEQLSLVS